MPLSGRFLRHLMRSTVPVSTAPGDVTDTVGVTDSLFVTGPVAPEADRVLYTVTKPDWAKDPSWSPDATHIVFTELIGSSYRISRVDSGGGNHTVLATGSAIYADPFYSPDGSMILFAKQTGAVTGPQPHGQWSLYVMEADGSNVTLVLNDGNANIHPCWVTETQIGFQSYQYGTTPSGFFISVIDVEGVNRMDIGEGEYPRAVTA